MARIAEDGQVTERFTRAVEHLGHDNRAVRLGAIYALERIAKDSARDRDTILETLAAYIREHAPWPPRGEDGRRLMGEAPTAKPELHEPPAIDIAAALTVICRLLPDGDPMRRKIDLRHTDLRGLDAPEINLSGMRLSQACLGHAVLREANLSDAVLNRAWLDHADLTGAVLRRANLTSAILSDAKLIGANLEDADLRWDQSIGEETRLPPRGVRGGGRPISHFYEGASLRRAELCGAKLNGAKLDGAVVSGADFKGWNLTQEQLDGVRYGTEEYDRPVNVPEGLHLPEPFPGPC